jgi:hypothetical protein
MGLVLADHPPETGGTTGVGIARVVAGMPAAGAGLQPGDRLLAVAGEAVGAPAAVRRRLASVVEGETVRVRVQAAAGAEREIQLEALARPLVDHEGCEVVYGELAHQGTRLRTIITGPETRGDGELPWVLYLQGHGAASVDGAPDRPLSALAGALARAGVVLVRVERPGSGDSEGPPLDRLTLEGERAIFAAAFEQARGRPGLAADRGFLFAHSLGGVIGCELAADVATRPRGLIVYGGGARTWTEYFDENCRRQWSLAGVGLAEQDRALRALQRFHSRLFVERCPLGELLAGVPEVAADPAFYAVESAQVLRGRPVAYWQGVHDAPVAAQLAGARVAVLAAWGASDWLSSRDDHELVAACANEGQAGLGVFAEIAGADHHLAGRATPAESFAARDHGQLCPRLAPLVSSWLRGVIGAR